MKSLDVIHVDWWEERRMEYGIGTTKIADTTRSVETLMHFCTNAYLLTPLKGVNGVQLIHTLDDKYVINQISGYTYATGMYCYMVQPDMTLERVI